jgi:hypothetical protein
MPDVGISGGGLLERRLAEIGRRLGVHEELRVGFLEGATYPDGTPVAMVAAVQEFGSPKRGIPPRPFFRNMVAAKKSEWGPAVAKLLVANDYDSHTALDIAGAAIDGQLRQSITELTDPPLSPVTLMVRQIVGPNGEPTFADVLEARRRIAAGEKPGGASVKPLVWTGHMLNSVDHEVGEVL